MGEEGSSSFRTGDPPVRLMLLVIATTVFLSALTGSMLNVVLPLIRSDFRASAADVSWIITGYSLAYAVGVPVYGRISDRYGIRRVFTLGLAGFALGGLICGLAPGLHTLIAGRFVQGAGGAAIPALAAVAVAKVLPPGQRGTALGLTTSAVGIGASVGPIVGGVLGQLLGWRPLLALPVALALVLIPLSLRYLPDGNQDPTVRFDLVGALLVGGCMGLLLYGVSRAQTGQLAATATGIPVLAAVLVGIVMAAWMQRAPEPFVPGRLLKNRTYITMMLVGFSTGFASLSAQVTASLMMAEVNHLSPGTAGLILTPGALALALASPLAGRLSDRWGVGVLVTAGLILLAVSTAMLSTVAGASPLLVALAIVLINLGSACTQSPSTNAAANALADRDLGVGMGLLNSAFFLGVGAGPAIAGTVLSARQDASAAVNPLYGLEAVGYSDAFASLLVPIAMALLAMWRHSHGRPVPSATTLATRDLPD